MRYLSIFSGVEAATVACERMGFEYVGFEINRTYYRIASNRIEEETRQLTLL